MISCDQFEVCIVFAESRKHPQGRMMAHKTRLGMEIRL